MRQNYLVLAAAGLAIAIAVVWRTPCKAAVVYDVNLTVGTGTVTGSITTDGTTGILNQSNITDWNLTINDGSGDVATLSPAGQNPQVIVSGFSLSADPVDLFFNFLSGETTFVLFQDQAGFLCFVASSGGLCSNRAEIQLGIFTNQGEISIDDFVPGGTQFVEIGQVATATPVPAALPLFATGLGGLGLLGWHRKRKARAVA